MIHFLPILGQINQIQNKVRIYLNLNLFFKFRTLVNVQNCAWTLVLREILRLTTLYPYSITSGLCLLTELLPIPLPHTLRQVNKNFSFNNRIIIFFILAFNRK